MVFSTPERVSFRSGSNHEVLKVIFVHFFFSNGFYLFPSRSLIIYLQGSSVYTINYFVPTDASLQRMIYHFLFQSTFKSFEHFSAVHFVVAAEIRQLCESVQVPFNARFHERTSPALIVCLFKASVKATL